MRKVAEPIVFTGLSILVLTSAFGFRFGDAGAASGGSGGDALVSIEASSASIGEMVEDWETPPEIVAQTAPPPPPPPQAAPQEMAALETPSMPETALPDAVALPSMPERPDLSREVMVPDAPPPSPEPQSDMAGSPRPPERPERPSEPRLTEKTQPSRTAPASAASQAQTSAGTGGSVTAGTTARSSASTLSNAQAQSLKAGWGASIRARIERRKRYPRAAGRAEGVVKVNLTVTRDGRLAALSLAGSSGNAALDKAALDAVKSAGRFPAAPKELTDGTYSFSLPMNFSR